MLLSVHIPKTGGTKLQSLLKQIYHNKIHFDYGTERDLVAARTCCPEILSDLEGFSAKFSCIYGHYHYLKYRDLFNDEKVIFVLRDPADRVISQYRHIALHGERSVERHRLIMDGQMDVVHFSKFKFIGNAQSIYLEGLDFETKNIFPLFAESFGSSVEGLLRWLNEDPDKYTKYLKSSDKLVNSREGMALPEKVIPIQEGDKDRIRKHCLDDLALIDRMRSFKPR